MRRLPYLDQRPIIVALTGPNGSGKTTFYHMLLEPAGLRFINADLLARELRVDAYQAVKLGNAIRRALVGQGESFVFETVFSDPVGDKRRFLQDAVGAGYTVVVFYIGVSSPTVSEERVALRVAKGGHNVPADKLVSRFPRTLSNLAAAIQELPHVVVFDNDDLNAPFRHVVTFEGGKAVEVHEPIPRWLRPALPAVSVRGVR